MFADNLVAHVFETEGVLEYSDELKRLIVSGTPIPIGSELEVELRAAEIEAVEQATKLLQEQGHQDIFPAMVDVYLWNLGQLLKYKSSLRHLTKTFFY